jgi:hypothetical protein
VAAGVHQAGQTAGVHPRRDPGPARPAEARAADEIVRAAEAKLKAIEGQIAELAVLQCRLRRLVHVCAHGNGDDCVALHLGTIAEGSGMQ